MTTLSHVQLYIVLLYLMAATVAGGRAVAKRKQVVVIGGIISKVTDDLFMFKTTS